MKRRAVVAYIVTILLTVCIMLASLFQISKSRTFQFFGEIVPRVTTKEKVVALTFDDGPTEYTNEVLETLKAKNVKATFFVIGNDIEKYPKIGKAVADSGHELGNHSYSHQRMWLKMPDFIEEEIESTNKLIRELGYKGTIHFRPPYTKKLFTLPWYLHQHAIKTITWDIEPDTYGRDRDFLTQYTIEHTKPGSIILLHPFCPSCKDQREAIEPIINGLKAKGYRFVTVSELLKFENK